MPKRLTNSAIRIIFSAAIIFCGALVMTGISVADDLKVAFSFAKPPYVFAEKLEDTYDLRGIELELMAKSLAFKGHTFTPVYTTYERLNGTLLAKRVNAAATVRPELKEAFYSKEFVYFRNFAITHTDTRPLKTMADLIGRSIVAWQGATKDLGPAFEAAAKQAGVYKEIPDQQRQVNLFLKQRVNTIVIDGAIFKFWARELGYDPNKFVYNPLFGGKTTFVVGFNSERLRDDFDAGLDKLRATGEYNEIYRRYIGN